MLADDLAVDPDAGGEDSLDDGSHGTWSRSLAHARD